MLGLAPGTSAAEIRGRYKDLVRRWHPDRFGGDPAGQAEASQRMREFNAAYAVLRRSFRAGWRPGAPHAAQSASKPPWRRLSRDEVDGLVGAIGTESPLDALLGTYDWYEDEIRFTFFAIFCGGLVAVAFLHFGPGIDLPLGTMSLKLLVPLALLGGGALAWLLKRRRARRSMDAAPLPALDRPSTSRPVRSASDSPANGRSRDGA